MSTAEMEVEIDAEFSKICPPLSSGEYELLKEAIKKDGVTDPIWVWDGKIVDGHNRWKICQELEIDCPSREIHFESRKSAILWIIENQLGRRNLTEIQASYLRAQLHNSMKLPLDGNENWKGSDSKRGETSVIVSEITGKSKGTIINDVRLSRALESMCDIAREYVLSGAGTVRKQHAYDLSCLEHDLQEIVIERVKSGTYKDLQSAILTIRPPKQPTATGETSILCKNCGMPYYKSVGKCLRCDVDKYRIREIITKNANPITKNANPITKDEFNRVNSQIIAEEESSDGWLERLKELRASGAGNNDLLFYSNQILDWIECNGEFASENDMEILKKLAAKLNQFIHGN